MKSVLAATAIGFLFLIYGTTNAVASTIYVVDRTFSQGVSVTGYIETNGQVGLLSNNDIIDWNFLFMDSFVLENRRDDIREHRFIAGVFVGLEPGVFRLPDGRVSATETGLFFDFSFTPFEIISEQLIVRSTVSAAQRRCAGGVITDSRQWSMEVSYYPEINEFVGESLQNGECPQPNVLNPAVDGVTYHSGVIQFASNQPLTNPILLELVNPVPVPAALWLFGTALIGLVGFNKRRKAV